MSRVYAVGGTEPRRAVLLSLMVLWVGSAAAQEGVTLRFRDGPTPGKTADVSEAWDSVSSLRLLPRGAAGLLASSRRGQTLERQYQEQPNADEPTVLARRYTLATVKDSFGATGVGGPAQPLPWAKRSVTVRTAADGTVSARVEGPPPLTPTEAAELTDDASRSLTLWQLSTLIGPPAERAVQIGETWKWATAAQLARKLAGPDVKIALATSPDATAMEVKLVELPGSAAKLEGRLTLSVVGVDGLVLEPPGSLTVVVRTQRTADGSDAAMTASVELQLLGRALSESDAKPVVVELRRELKAQLTRSAEK